MNCPECRSDLIWEQGTVIKRKSITWWENEMPAEWGIDALVQGTYEVCEKMYWCENCEHEFNIFTEAERQMANDIKRDIDPPDNGQETFPYNSEID